MQTFLPFPSFIKSAQCLDNKRLGKERIEVMQILKAITNPEYGWQNHPIVNMWRGYEAALCAYGTIICDEWISRGFKDTVRGKLTDAYKFAFPEYPLPIWFGNDEFHKSHQSNLLRKDYEHYSKYFNITDDLPYQWYSQEKGFYIICNLKKLEKKNEQGISN